ncbi:hypothetical protein [Sphingomonas lacusdianchii]|uniref:hypothetical protein n=1 Tax=Sphingomonas lacusdianchii TaxID=2917992 RepID=UPI001F586B67|nr:hypothetical protein [Sphingomonas sp. JXJ CY 53]
MTLFAAVRAALAKTPARELLGIADFSAFALGVLLLVATDPTTWIISARFAGLFLLYLALRAYAVARLLPRSGQRSCDDRRVG